MEKNLIGLIILFSITPLLVCPASDDSFILPKNVFIKIVTLALLFSNIESLRIKTKELLRIQNPIDILLILFLFLNLFSISYASSFLLAYKESIRWLFLIFLFFIFTSVIKTHNQLYKLFLTNFLTSTIVAVWTIFQDYGLDFFAKQPKLPDWRGFLVAGMGNSDYVAGYLVTLFPMVLLFYLIMAQNIAKLLISLVAISTIFASLIITFSVGANFGLFVSLLLLAVTIHKSNYKAVFSSRTKWKKWVILFFILILISCFYIIPNPYNGRGISIFQQAFASYRWREGSTTRLVIWLNTIELIKSCLFWGVGSGNFTYRYLDFISPKVLASPKMCIYAGEYTNAAHNEFLQILSELGLPGLICFLGIIYFFYRKAFYLYNKSCEKLQINEKSKDLKPFMILSTIGGMTSMLIYGLTSYPLHLPSTVLLFIFYLSIIRILENSIEFKKDFQINRRRKSSSLFLILLLIIFAYLVSKPLLADIYFKIGKYRKEASDIIGAKKAFVWSTFFDTHADSHYHLGEVYLQEGDIESALKEFLEARKQRNDKYLLQKIALAYSFLGERNKAKLFLQILNKRKPQTAAFFKN